NAAIAPIVDQIGGSATERELSLLLDFGEMSKAGAILDEPAGDPIGVARVEIQPSFDEEDAPPGLRERVPERGTAHSRPDDDGVPRRSLGMSIGDHGRHQTPSATITPMLALISFDAVARPLFDRMIAQGRLPNCALLMRNGRTYSMETTPFHASVYRSLYTGF